MNKTRPKKYNEITNEIDKEKDIISVVSCNTCTRLSNTGGETKLLMMAKRLKRDGYNVVDAFLITMPCVDFYIENLNINSAVNTLVMLACSCGCANAKVHFPNKKIVPALDDRGTLVVEKETKTKKWRVPQV